MFLIPSSGLKPLADIISKIGFLAAGKIRNIAKNSLELAFEDSLTKAEKDKIAKDSFRYMVEGGFELLYCIEHPEYINQIVDIKGKDHLDEALSHNRGVIAVTAHFGNFPIMQFRLAQAGYNVNSIIRHMRDKMADEYFLRKRNKVGVKTIYTEPRSTCVLQSARSLKGNEVLFILLDQNFGTGGVFVDFFGKKAATATGPIILAQRTKAVIMPMFIVHNNQGRHTLFIEPEFKLEENDNKEKTILLNIQRLTGIIEKYIRQYPAEWSWIHRRWKTRPKPAGNI
jgi:KDO2-lipid IV(A) lauroyltransferase